jgi:hypothetical protein
MNAQTPTDLWDQLEQALAVQAQALRQSQWQQLESAVRRSRALVDQISRTHAPKPLPASRGQQILRTYERLMLTAEAQKQAVTQQLRRLGSGRRALGAYQPHR